VISNNAETLDTNEVEGLTKDISGTRQAKQFTSTITELDASTVKQNSVLKVYNSTEDIESALYESKDKIQIIVNGIKNYIDTCNFYGRLYKECQDNPSWRLFKNGFDKPTYEETSVIPRLKIDKADYIIDTLIKFVNIKNQSISEIIKNKVKEEFKKSDYHNVNCNQLYNKIVYCVCILNKLFNNTDNLECIIYYGYVRSNDIPVISILNEADLVSLVIACSDKQKSITIPGMSLLELESSTEIFEMPIVDKRDNSSTLAAQAEHRANTTLFDGNTLGFYKHGQFRTARIKHFNTTFDEIKLWWNRELYLRPGFESLGDTAVIPSITKLIKGVKDDEQKYLELIQMFSCGKTILCKSLTEFSSMKSSGSRMHILRCVDINGTRFEDQKPFYENSKLNKSRIKSAKNYSYGFMDLHKQDFILDNIELILNYNYIKLNGINKQEYTDLVLNTLLNLDKTLLQYIQWFEYYTYNPNLILIINEETTMSLENMILLTFMSNIGFDVLIFVPTGYTTIENLVGPLFMYDEHIIGEYEYSINTNNISVTSNIEIIDNQKEEKKQGFFGKLFSKGEN
ncbi:MAG: hypothetical protein J6A59_18975, partial [Lachnospiraceae bacterium]|nr:hypothetical protein [Lachnospiraceae bacterium]